MGAVSDERMFAARIRATADQRRAAGAGLSADRLEEIAARWDALLPVSADRDHREIVERHGLLPGTGGDDDDQA